MTQTQRIGLLVFCLALFALLWRQLNGDVSWTDVILPVLYGAAGAALFVGRRDDA